MLDSNVEGEGFVAMVTYWADNNQGWVALLTIVAIAVYIYISEKYSKKSKHTTTTEDGGYGGDE